MRRLRQISVAFMAAAILMAPLLCVRFCHVREEVAATAAPMPMDMTAMAHHTSHEHEHEHEHERTDGQRAPLNSLKQMVSSVTEFIAAAAAVFILLVLALRVRPAAQFLYRRTLDVLTPPPRAAFI